MVWRLVVWRRVRKCCGVRPTMDESTFLTLRSIAPSFRLHRGCGFIPARMLLTVLEVPIYDFVGLDVHGRREMEERSRWAEFVMLY